MFVVAKEGFRFERDQKPNEREKDASGPVRTSGAMQMNRKPNRIAWRCFHVPCRMTISLYVSAVFKGRAQPVDCTSIYGLLIACISLGHACAVD
jgi:hypothetical protein